MDAINAASAHSFFNNEDSTPTYLFSSRSILRISIFILYMKLQLIDAASPADLYWKSMLPTAPIPKSISVLLHPPAGNSTITELIPENCAHDPVCLGSPGQSAYGSPYSYGQYYYGRPYIYGRAGHNMKFLFEKTANQASFLPRQVVKSIPFSSTKMVEILNKFDVKPGSVNAEVMKSTIKVCEQPAVKGEDKYCATSLESMLDFTILKLGKNVEALSTEVNKNETNKQEYTIRHAMKVGEANLVVCHKLNYVYAVFYCHKIENSVVYTVSLEGADRSKVKAVTVCHRDTSAWNPKHLAFQMLKVKPGSGSICHFLFLDTIAWVHRQN